MPENRSKRENRTEWKREIPRSLGELGQSVYRMMQEEYPERVRELVAEGTLIQRLHEREKELREKKLELLQDLTHRYPRPLTENFGTVVRHIRRLEIQAEELLAEEILQPV